MPERGCLSRPTTTRAFAPPLLRVMKNLNKSESAAVLEILRDTIAALAINPDLHGEALVDSVPKSDLAMINPEIVRAYVKLAA